MRTGSTDRGVSDGKTLEVTVTAAGLTTALSELKWSFYTSACATAGRSKTPTLTVRHQTDHS